MHRVSSIFLQCLLRPKKIFVESILEYKSDDFRRIGIIAYKETDSRTRRRNTYSEKSNSGDDLYDEDKEEYNDITQILTLADETYIALSTIYVVVFGLQSKNENVINYLLTPDGSVACYVSALDNFGHLLKLLNENKPVSKYAKYIARITNGLDNYMHSNSNKQKYIDLPYLSSTSTLNPIGKTANKATKSKVPQGLDINAISAFCIRGQHDKIIDKLKHGERGDIKLDNHSSPSLKELWIFLDTIKSDYILSSDEQNRLIILLLSCFQEANTEFYDIVLAAESVA